MTGPDAVRVIEASRTPPLPPLADAVCVRGAPSPALMPLTADAETS
ncbi:hypothetical protein OG413_00495 [Streptomyces sp. NBC_01433]|nr:MULTISPECIES: hypothetical protein [unclassified Streptomyces]MCX4673817.1 hypothetical protein [Streptomyces sp. NBC_01433]